MGNVARAIRGIQVHKLFGTYDYGLSPSARAPNPERLIILYGDNGSGKTTILKVLFHLLAPEDGEGHKTALAGIPFRRLDVELTTGDHIWAERPEGRILGSFAMGLHLARRKETRVEFTANEENVIKPTSQKHNVQIKAFLGKLRQLNMGLYFLSDDRTVRLAGRERRETPLMHPDLVTEEEHLFYQDLPPQARRMRGGLDIEVQAQQLLVESIRRAEMWIQSQTVRRSAEGESNVNVLYTEILQRIGRLPLDQKPSPDEAVSSIEERVAQLEIRSKNYSQYGLLPEFTGKDIISIAKKSPPSHTALVRDVITPYLESVEKKLDAMEGLHRQIDALVRIVNSFFTRKKLTFEVHKGFDIRTEDGKELAPHMLSSGERHLLLLFCNTVISLDRPSIFMIDEPEISLNIKWQRRLLSCLMECAADNPVQYVFATHSFELLAQHRDNVITLSETSETHNGRETNA
jgi:energy-coupling factor transporter ATP-binding protein EcfA2